MSINDRVNCAVCGKEHLRSELELAFRRPDPIVALAAEERATRVKETDDLCAIDYERYFVRSVLPLPVHSREEPYQLGLWVEVPRDSFMRIYELWSDPDQANEPAFAGSLANDIPSFAPTCGLAINLYLTGPSTRPTIVVADQGHPLFHEQAAGITEHRAHEYSSFFA